MRTKTFFLFFTIISLSFINCDENNEILNNSIDGTWNLQTLNGGLSPSITYQKGDITWEINTEAKTIKIQNNLENINTQFLYGFTDNQTGTYNFEIEKTDGLEYLVVGDRKGEISFISNNLKIDYGVALDDISYTFYK